MTSGSKSLANEFAVLSGFGKTPDSVLARPIR